MEVAVACPLLTICLTSLQDLEKVMNEAIKTEGKFGP